MTAAKDELKIMTVGMFSGKSYALMTTVEYIKDFKKWVDNEDCWHGDELVNLNNYMAPEQTGGPVISIRSDRIESIVVMNPEEVQQQQQKSQILRPQMVPKPIKIR